MMSFLDFWLYQWYVGSIKYPAAVLLFLEQRLAQCISDVNSSRAYFSLGRSNKLLLLLRRKVFKDTVMEFHQVVHYILIALAGYLYGSVL